MILTSQFPKSFQQYRPRSHKVFGIICYTRTEKKYLLVRGKRVGKWSFPKGHMEGRESALECALRELWEETGITLERRIHHGTIKLSKNSDGKNSEYFVYSVDCEMPITINDSNEIIDAGWFSIEEIKTMYCNIDVTNFHMRNGRLGEEAYDSHQ